MKALIAALFVALACVLVVAQYRESAASKRLADANLHTAMCDLATTVMQERAVNGLLPKSVNVITPNANGDARSRFVDFSTRWPDVILVDGNDQAGHVEGRMLIYTVMDGGFQIAAHDGTRIVGVETYEIMNAIN